MKMDKYEKLVAKTERITLSALTEANKVIARVMGR